jgi:Uma2 family endonuclease
MATDSTTTPPTNVAELLERLGDLPAERVRMQPPPGTATEDDVVAAWKGPERRLCELVEGTLVEKALGSKESLLATEVARRLGNFVHERDLGAVLGADGMLRLYQGLVRIPDVSYTAWERVPNHEWPDEPVAAIVPDLAVEVISKNNTKAEIKRKLREYFLAGTRLAWVIDPKKQTATIYTSADKPRAVGKTGSLDGGALLPGFRLPLPELFARTKRRSPPS